jgi:trk system potassium uptake protein TrkA
MKQFAVIGLGNFGYYLATRLHEKGHDVLAVDLDPKRIQEIKDHVGQAIVADATDQEAMLSLGLRQMDAVIVCIGTSLNQSILATLLMKEIGVKTVLAKAIQEPHGRILEKIGADEVLFPEKDLALHLAERLHNPNVLTYLPLTEGYSILELAPPNDWIGKSLAELNLIARFGIQVLAVKEFVPERVTNIPGAGFVVKDSDLLIVMGPNKALEQLQQK